jgi:hypothetical protein
MLQPVGLRARAGDEYITDLLEPGNFGSIAKRSAHAVTQKDQEREPCRMIALAHASVIWPRLCSRHSGQRVKPDEGVARIGHS